MSKGLETKTNILEIALGLVRRIGFEGVSISQLAKEVGMSKSGLFAHFNSKEKMHIMILDHAAQSFTLEVFIPAFKEKRGIERLRRIVRNWITWYGNYETGGCPFLAAGLEYDSRPGEVQDRLRLHLGTLIKSIRKAVEICIEEGQVDEGHSPKQIAYEIYSAMIGAQVYTRTLGRKDARGMLKATLESIYQRYALQECDGGNS